MEDRETGTILQNGTAVLAPVYVPVTGLQPAWCGRPVYELSQSDIEGVNDFCMEEAWNVGYEDAASDLPERANPFHRQFMQGLPYSIFMTYYMRGRSAAQRGCEQMIGLFARRGVAEAR